MKEYKKVSKGILDGSYLDEEEPETSNDNKKMNPTSSKKKDNPH